MATYRYFAQAAWLPSKSLLFFVLHLRPSAALQRHRKSKPLLKGHGHGRHYPNKKICHATTLNGRTHKRCKQGRRVLKLQVRLGEASYRAIKNVGWVFATYPFFLRLKPTWVLRWMLSHMRYWLCIDDSRILIREYVRRQIRLLSAFDVLKREGTQEVCMQEIR